MAEGNIIVNQAGNLCGIIDFAMLGQGDPTCALVKVWTFLNQESRAVFKKPFDMDENTCSRARGRAFWRVQVTKNLRETILRKL